MPLDEERLPVASHSLLNLNRDEAKWVKLKWREIREANQRADAANMKWKQVNAEITSYLDRSGDYDEVQRAKVKGESLALKDALSVGNWHSRNAERHIHDLQLFLRLKELGIL